MNRTESLRERAAAWCTADDPKLACGTGPLARDIYMLRLLAAAASARANASVARG